MDGEVRERLRQLLVQRTREMGLTPAIVEVLRRSACLERWAAGDVIRMGGGPDPRLGVVVVGAVKVVCETPRGKRVGVSFVPPGRLVPGGWAAQSRGASFTAFAHDPLGTIVASWVPRAVLDVLAGLPAASVLQLVGTIAQDAVDVVEQKCHLLGMGLRDRVLATLTTLARDFGQPHPDGVCIALRLTHVDLAGAAVGSRANITRALEDLRTNGLVAVERHRLIVTHRGLASFRTDVPVPTSRWASTLAASTQ
jgi:CRP-like cAMP-binding protein